MDRIQGPEWLGSIRMGWGLINKHQRPVPEEKTHLVELSISGPFLPAQAGNCYKECTLLI